MAMAVLAFHSVVADPLRMRFWTASSKSSSSLNLKSAGSV